MPSVPRHAPRATSRPARRWPVVALVLVGVIVGMLFAFWRALRYEPDFYRQALNVPSYREIERSTTLERQVETLQAQVRTDETWQQVFTEEELNAWLAVQLPERYSHLLPSGMSDPRVVLDERRVRFGARYESGGVTAVLSLEIEVALADEPNGIRLRIVRARAGAVPVPLEKWIEQAAVAARRSELPLRIESVDGVPVIDLTVPSETTAWPDRRLVLDRLELSQGRLTLGGRSEPK